MNSTSIKSSDIQTGAARVVDAVSDISEQASEQASKFAQSAAETVREASGYLRDKGGDAGAELKRYLKANPTHALIGAAVVGFLVGRFMSRN